MSNHNNKLMKKSTLFFQIVIFISFILYPTFYFAQTTDTYTASGTWTCPAGVTSATIECYGAGGGGAGSTSTNGTAGGGGGGGAYVMKTITVSAGNYTITIGAGGIGGAAATNGTAGGNTIFGSNLVIANGGGPGLSAASGAGGTGGIASGGTTNYNGGNGANGVSGSYAGGGGSGAGSTAAGNNSTSATGGAAVTVDGGAGGDGGCGTGAQSGWGCVGSVYGGGGGGGYGKNKPGADGAAGLIKITYTTPKCPSATSVAPSTTQTLCQNSSAAQLTATPSYSGTSGAPTLLYQWYYNTTNSNTIAGATVVSGATASTYTPVTTVTGTRYYFCVCYATDNGCSQTSTTQSLSSNTVQITVNTTPTAVTVTGGGTYCGSTTLTASGGTGGTIYWQNTTSGGTSTATPSSSQIVSSSGTYYFRANVGTCWSVEGSATATINPNPTITLGANPSVCKGSTSANLTYSATTGSPDKYSINYDATAEAQGFVDVTNAVLPASPVTLVVPAGATAGTYNYTLTVSVNATGCSSTAYAKTITINALPTITLGSAPSVCPGITTANLTYSATTGSPDKYSINYDAAAEAQGFVDVANIALPASPIVLTVPGGAPTGTYNYDLTVTNSTNTCVSLITAKTVIITAGTPSVPGAITGSTPVAQNTSGLVYSITAVPNATTYTWTVPTGWTINSGQGTISVSVTSGNAGQNGNITVTAGNTCGTSTASSFAVTVVANNCPTSTTIAPAATQTKCQGVSASQLTATINLSGGSGTPTLQYQWYYNATNSNTIAGATLISGATSSTYTPLTGAGELGTRYYFCVGYATDNSCSQTNASQSLASNTVQITVNPPTSSAPVSLAGSAAGCNQITANWNSSANATNYRLDVSLVNDFSSFVAGYQDLSVGNVTTYDVVSLTSGTTYYYRVRAENSCGTSANSGTITYATSPSTPSTPGSITGSTSVDPVASGLVYSISSVTNATTYTWTVPTGWTINSGQGTVSISATSGTSGQNGNITVTAGNSCGTSATSILAVTVLASNCPASTSVAPTATQTMCQDVAASQLTATITLSGGAGTPTQLYQWYYNTTNSNTVTGATIVSGATSSTYTPLSGASEVGTRYYFCVGYATNNGCGQTNTTQSLASNTVQITVNPGTPSVPGVISGATPVNEYIAGLVYSISSVTNATTYTWTVPTGWTINSGQGTTSISVTSGAIGENGNITVTAGNSCGTSAASSKAVTVELIVNPTITLGSNPSVCKGTTTVDLTYSGTTNSPDQYSIDYDATANTKGFIDKVNVALPASPISLTVPAGAPAGVYNAILTVRNSGTSAVSENYNITVTVVANTSAANAGTAATICATSVKTLSATNPLVGTGQWSIDSGPSTLLTQISDINLRNATFTPTGGAGVYILRWTVSNPPCASTSSTVSITVNEPPTTSNAGVNQTVDCVNFSTFSANTPVYGTGTWSVLSGGPATVTTPTSPTSGVTGLAIGSNGFRWTIANPGCASSFSNVYLTRTTTPNAPGTISGTTSPYASVPGLTYTVASVTYATTYTWTVPAGWTITSGQGTRTIKVTSGAVGQDGNITVTTGNACGTSAASVKAVTTQAITAHSNCDQCHTDFAHNFTIAPAAGNANLCINCHNPAGAALNKPLTDAMKAFPGVSGNSHQWDIESVNPTLEVNSPSTSDLISKMDGTKIICSTCHNPHNQTSSPYLRISNVGDALCKDCHSARNIATYSSNPAINKGSHPVGVVYPTSDPDFNAAPTDPKVLVVGSNVECSSCHGIHDPLGTTGISNDGYLLRVTNDNALCNTCHTYSTHQANNCKTCHKTHNTNKSNIMMIANSILGNTVNFTAKTGANSFSDGNATYDGVCEACHTSKTYFVNANRAIPGTSGSSHNWDVNAVNASYETNTPSDAGMAARVYSSKIQCVTCHNQHSDAIAKSLRLSNTGDALCKDCHSARNIATYSANPATNKGSHPVGVSYPPADPNYNASPSNPKILTPGSKVECSSCHGVHDPSGTLALTNDGNLLRLPNDNALCNTCHTYSTHQTNGCKTCHDTHNSNKSNIVMIANSILGNTVNFTTRTGTNSFADGNATYDAVCEACHTSKTYFVNAKRAIPGTSGNSHNWDVNAVNATYETNSPSNSEMAARIYSGKMSCVTCHNQHSDAIPKSLRMANTADAMCKDCHTARNKGKYITAPATNKGTHPVGITYPGSNPDYNATPTSPIVTVGGNVECSSCHGVHDVAGTALTTDGMLLKSTNNATLCLKCHKYQNHQGMDCLKCHQAHNTNKSNIYMVRNTIATPNSGNKTVVFTAETGTNSFADANATYDGVCEVCHTAAASIHHHNDATGDHNHYNGQNCTTCHPHNDATESFKKPDCNACHLSNYPQHATNGHDAHTVKYAFDCSTCHFGYGSGGASEPTHPSGTINVAFNPTGLAKRNGSDANTPTWTAGTKLCSNIYCHSDGRTAIRGTDGVDTWSSTIGPQAAIYATTPRWDTGTITACTPCHVAVGNMTSPYTITTPGPVTGTADVPATGSHQRGAHTSNSQELSGVAWANVNCFWCHNTQGGSSASPNMQGTYGTTFHVDGLTRFKPLSVVDGGTMVNNLSGGSFSYSKLGSAGHCGAGKTCW